MPHRPIEACLTATEVDYVRLVAIARGLERYFRFVARPRGDTPLSADRRPVRLHFTARRLPEPFVVDPDKGVAVSTWDIEGTCRYAGIDEQTYLLICSLVGIAHWRVLKSNPLLQPDDLRHPAGVHCVYADPRQVSDYALLLDSPTVCKGCTDFYRCLGADTELLALREVVDEIARRSDFGSDGGSAEETSEYESDV